MSPDLPRQGMRTGLLLLGPALPCFPSNRLSQLCSTLEHLHIPRQQSQPGKPTWPLVVTCATDVNTDPSASGPRTQTWPPSCSTGWNITMTSGGHAGYLHQVGSQHHHLWIFTLLFFLGSSESHSNSPSHWVFQGKEA